MNLIKLETSPMDLALPILGSVGVAGSVCNAVIAYICQTLDVEPSIAS